VRGKRVLRLCAAVAVIIAVACFGEAWRTVSQPRHLLPAVSSGAKLPTLRIPVIPAAVAVVRANAEPMPVRSTEPVAAPVRVEVPAVGLSAPVTATGLGSDGSIELPAVSVAGWYREGPAPGAIGPAVLVGHVDSRSGPAVFYRLTALRVGDVVVVDRADGSAVRFQIYQVTVVRKSAFPTAAVFAPTAGADLRLVTCTGVFDPAQHHYLDSLIAWAKEVP
jgi:sortase (surface protein transpeptidase)